MENINYNLILSGADFKEIMYLSKFIYFSLKNENFNVSLLIKPASNISNYSLSYAVIKVGKFESISCLQNIDALISLDYQSTLNYLPFMNKNTLVLSDYSAFNVCDYWLTDNDAVSNKLNEKTVNVYKIPLKNIIDMDAMGKNKVSAYIALIGAFIAKSNILDLDSVFRQTALFSKNDAEKKNAIQAILKGYDYVSEA
jgi:Pyruvate/2-oxoacid:ferredoxin oxidoreductase gamma subunit